MPSVTGTGGEVDLEFEWFPNPLIYAQGFDNMSVAIADFESPLSQSAAIAAKDAQDRFANEGPGWPPWALLGAAGPSGPYAESYTGKIGLLQSSGDMAAHASSAEAYDVGLDTLTYFPLYEIVDIVHQEGSPARNIYARPFVGLSAEGEAAVMLIFEEWLDGLIGDSMPGGDGGGTLGPTSVAAYSGVGKYIGQRGPGGRFVKRGG